MKTQKIFFTAITFFLLLIMLVSPNLWTVTELSEARYNLSAAAFGNKIIFAGGNNGTGNYTKTVDIYGGGYNSTAYSQTVDVFILSK